MNGNENNVKPEWVGLGRDGLDQTRLKKKKKKRKNT